MKRYAVFGAGLMGRVIAEDLVETESEAEVTLFDVSDERLQEVAASIDCTRLVTRKLDATDTVAGVQAMRGRDVAIGALPHGLSLALIEAAVEAGTDFVDLVGSGPERRAALHDRAREAGCLIIPGCGVAPGISNMCVGRGVELLDETESALIYVGGIPKRKRPPLFYETVYLLESVFNAYEREATIIEDGQESTVKPLTGLETITFAEPIGALEAFYTDGLASLTLTMRGKIQGTLFEKTLRHPGHVERIQTLKQCGLLSREPVRLADVEVVPRELLLELLGERLTLGPEGDMLAMRIIVEGKKDGFPRRHTFELIDHFDPERKHTAMARTTAFPAATAARMITGDELRQKGVFFPEQVFTGSRFGAMMDALAARGVRVTHREIWLSETDGIP